MMPTLAKNTLLLTLFLLTPILIFSTTTSFRPPAAPLLVTDPYLHVWSPSDHLADSWPSYWSGTTKALCGLIRVDGHCYRWMGVPHEVMSDECRDVMKQEGYAVVRPTVTTYVFETTGILRMVVNFTTPAIFIVDGEDDPFDLMSRPVTFVDILVESIDGKEHSVEVYIDNTGEFAVNKVDERVVWNFPVSTDSLRLMRIGTKEQDILGMSGDNVGINWGYFYASTDGRDSSLSSVAQSSRESRRTFASTGKLPLSNDTRMPRRASDDWPVLAFSWAFKLHQQQQQNKRIRVLYAYDDLFSIKWDGSNFLPPLWRHKFPSGGPEMLQDTFDQAEAVLSRCYAFDEELIRNLTRVGGPNYALLGSLAYRQAFAGTKIVWNEKIGAPWAFLKEISSDGDLSTVDVLFPASPLYLLYSTELVKLLLLPIFSYANNETSVSYPFPFAPHHLGKYPIAHILPSQQENMPMEESGNVLMLTAAVGLAQKSFAFVIPKYSVLLKTWAEDIAASLPDPGKQLCTDDFEGPTEHNANLAAKGIVGLEAYANILEATGDLAGAVHYRTLADGFAKDWMRLSNPNNSSDHYRLQYNLPKSWSQKYNLLFARLLPNMHAFPESVFQMESEYYLRSQMDEFGVPLDDRHAYTKIDWSNWIGAMSDNNRELFDQVVGRSLAFADKTPQRVPLSDWYSSTTGDQRGFQGRPVVGGLFARLLREQGMSPK